MRILWTSNVIFPEAAEAIGQPASVFGGWMTSLADDMLSAGIKLAVLSLYKGNKIKKIETSKAVYYLIPGLIASRYRYDNRLKKYYRQVLDEFSPDCIHIHGTEYTYPLPLVEVAGNIPVVVSIQGIVGVCERYYLAGLRITDIIRYSTFSDIVFGTGVLSGRSRFQMRARYENRLIASVSHMIGRTEWDYCNVLAINPGISYHKCNESLRLPFYSGGWSIDKCSRHTVFTSQSPYPLKGLHVLLQAVSLLKTEFPDIRLYVAGPKFTNPLFKNMPLQTGYGVYIKHLIKKYNIQTSVEFIGMLSAEAMAGRLASANVFVLASSIENSPNSLGEAQLVGTPCVASYVGGIPDMVTDGVDGLLYNYQEPAILANKIRKIFCDDDMARALSANGRKRALIRHDRQSNLDTMIKIYSELSSNSVV